MDGTLVDSTAIVERAWEWWAKRHNVPLDEVLRFSHGRPTLDTMRHFQPGVDHAAELAEMTQYEETETGGIISVKGAEAAVLAASQGLWGVVTSAPRRLAEIRIALAGLPLPDVLISSDETQRGKPDPESYLKAADRLGVHPADCLVFEDTGPGVNAGLRAGMQVIALLTTVPRDQLPCERVVRDFRDVSIRWRKPRFEVIVSQVHCT